jgi:hypothetical protein
MQLGYQTNASYTPINSINSTDMIYCQTPIVNLTITPSKTILRVGELLTINVSMNQGAPVYMNISYGDVNGTTLIVPVSGE